MTRLQDAGVGADPQEFVSLLGLCAFSELWWAGMRTPDSQGSVADVLYWLPWDMGKGALRRKPRVFPAFIVCRSHVC